MPFFILKLFCEMNVYLPNLGEYFETARCFRMPKWMHCKLKLLLFFCIRKLNFWKSVVELDVKFVS